ASLPQDPSRRGRRRVRQREAALLRGGIPLRVPRADAPGGGGLALQGRGERRRGPLPPDLGRPVRRRGTARGHGTGGGTEVDRGRAGRGAARGWGFLMSQPGGEIVVYESPDGEVRFDVRLERETVWLTQQQMSKLFGRERSVVTKHIRNAFKERELDPK